MNGHHRPILTIVAAILLAGAGCAELGPPRYTIMLSTVKHPAHVQVVQEMKDVTEEHAGWEDLFVVHGNGLSHLYWGHFASVDGASWSVRRAQRFKTPDGIKPFTSAMVVALPAEAGPPEFDLNNAGGKYTLAVAQFYDVPEAKYLGREQSAIDYCQELRDLGYPAYFYHRGVNSYVTVGSFPKTAYQMEMTPAGQHTGEVYYSPELQQLKNDERFRAYAINGHAEVRRTGSKDAEGQLITTPYVMDIPLRPDAYE